MSYDFFAAGAVIGSYGHSLQCPTVKKTDRQWGDEWQLNKVLDTFLGTKGVNTGAGSSLTADAMGKIMPAMAESQFKRFIGQSLRFLMIESRGGKISVSSRDRGVFYDTPTLKSFHFTAGNLELPFRYLLTHLEKSKLNKIGPLTDILTTMCNWHSKVGNGEFMYAFDFEW